MVLVFLGNVGASSSEKLITDTEGYKQLAMYALMEKIVVLLISPIVRKLIQEIK